MMYFVGILHRQSDLPATVSSVCAYSASLSSGGRGFSRSHGCEDFMAHLQDGSGKATPLRCICNCGV